MVNVVGGSQDYRIKAPRLVLMLLCVICVCVSGFTHGQSPAVTKPSDVRLVIDISGSMKKNDPKNLRRPALDMLVQLLPEGSSAGIWTFGQYVNMLVPHQPVTAAWGSQASAAASEIKSIAQFTNIGAALEEAAYDHKKLSGDDNVYQTHVILLTDGMVDIDRDNALNDKERQRIVDKVLPMYQQAGITLHTIALSDNADKNLLNKLALGTDGKVATAKNAEELMGVFLQVFDQAVPLESIPFDGDRFAVDSSIEEFTALIFRQKNAKSTMIVSPDGEQYNKDTTNARVNWYHTDQYDLITIKQPFEGEWQVSADVAPQSRVTVVSDLSVAVRSMPTNIPVNEVVQTSLVLREENKTIKRPEFLELLTITANVTSSMGNDWSQTLSSSDETSKAPSDGVYSATFNQFSEQGDYTINFLVEGKTFNRQYTHQLSVRNLFVVNAEKTKINGITTFSILVSAQSPTIDLTKTKVTSVITFPSGKANAVNFNGQQDDDTWMLEVAAEENGDYIVDIRVNSVDDEGVREKIILDPLILSPNEDDIFNITPSEPSLTDDEPLISESTKPFEPTAVAETETEEIKEASSEEEAIPETQVDYSQYILYGIIALINIIIVAVGYIVYRKLFKSAPAELEDEEGEDKEDVFVEPPMDEMAVDELLDDEIAEKTAVDKPAPEPVPTSSNDADNAMAAALMDAEDADDDIPDFSLDDFSPESIDDDELSEELDLDEDEKK
ncbi:MAG: hypothetical protein ACI8VC_000826 [Candidatus Endobugula sp.]|jgi:uncharacterized protein (TIGR03503 family)